MKAQKHLQEVVHTLRQPVRVEGLCQERARRSVMLCWR